MTYVPRITTEGSTLDPIPSRGESATPPPYDLSNDDIATLWTTIARAYYYIKEASLTRPQENELLKELNTASGLLGSLIERRIHLGCLMPLEALKPDPCDPDAADDDDDPDERAWQEYLDGLIPGERAAAERFDINNRKAQGLPPRPETRPYTFQKGI